MVKPLNELETLLQQMVVEHEKMLRHLDAQQAAMKKLDVKAMDAAAHQQEACRLRITTLENKRKTFMNALAKQYKISPDIRMIELAKLDPQRGPMLMKLREQLRGIAKQITDRTYVSGRLAGAVLGHLNTVVRLLATVMEQSGVYTKQGVPRIAPRVGSMDAVG